jgi:hypothetical protein
MKILAIEIEKEGIKPQDYKPYLLPEARKVWELYQSDIIREIYFDKEKSSAVLILECSSKNQAVEILNSLPLVKEGLISFDIFTLEPYPGFGRLM